MSKEKEKLIEEELKEYEKKKASIWRTYDKVWRVHKKRLAKIEMMKI